jgi:SAM-dependent methyltransferase
MTTPFEISLSKLQHKIVQRGDLPHVSIKSQMKYIEELSQFALGRALLENRSIDAFWTDFMTTCSVPKKCSHLEEFILHRSPFTLAWRELLKKFRKVTQENLRDNMILVSVPCGAMRELLELDYSSVSNVSIIGIDIDPDSLLLAQKLAEKMGLSSQLSLCQQDAWQLSYNSEIDLITSCGLNIYVADRQKVLDLYRQFLKALKPGGKLIIGFLTYPPGEKVASEWQLEGIPSEDLLLERILYKDILDLQWRNFRTSQEFEKELREVGFSEVIFHYDTRHIFPAVVATKK